MSVQEYATVTLKGHSNPSLSLILKFWKIFSESY